MYNFMSTNMATRFSDTPLPHTHTNKFPLSGRAKPAMTKCNVYGGLWEAPPRQEWKAANTGWVIKWISLGVTGAPAGEPSETVWHVPRLSLLRGKEAEVFIHQLPVQHWLRTAPNSTSATLLLACSGPSMLPLPGKYPQAEIGRHSSKVLLCVEMSAERLWAGANSICYNFEERTGF